MTCQFEICQNDSNSNAYKDLSSSSPVAHRQYKQITGKLRMLNPMTPDHEDNYGLEWAEPDVAALNLDTDQTDGPTDNINLSDADSSNPGDEIEADWDSR